MRISRLLYIPLLLLLLISCNRDEDIISTEPTLATPLEASKGTVSYNTSSPANITAEFNEGAKWRLTFIGRTSGITQTFEKISKIVDYSWNGVIANALQLTDETFDVILSYDQGNNSHVGIDTTTINVVSSPQASDFDIVYSPVSITSIDASNSTRTDVQIDNSGDFKPMLRILDKTVFTPLVTAINRDLGRQAIVSTQQRSSTSNFTGSFLDFWYATGSNTLDLTGFTYNNLYINFYVYANQGGVYSYTVNYNEDGDSDGSNDEGVSANSTTLARGWQLVSLSLANDFTNYRNSFDSNANPDRRITVAPDHLHEISMRFSTSSSGPAVVNFHQIALGDLVLTRNKPLQEILDDFNR